VHAGTHLAITGLLGVLAPGGVMPRRVPGSPEPHPNCHAHKIGRPPRGKRHSPSPKGWQPRQRPPLGRWSWSGFVAVRLFVWPGPGAADAVLALAGSVARSGSTARRRPERSSPAVSAAERIGPPVLRHLDRRPSASVCERLVVEPGDDVQVGVVGRLPRLREAVPDQRVAVGRKPFVLYRLRVDEKLVRGGPLFGREVER
jgi:hypothetical protein